ncbi:hypothetical protein [Neptuniibacter halophilus]|uniref:hypothetical protein n=1 Tax=Neptuniibacter halophilus TaxID=651666 RepID=UPI0025745E7D|nr:hypothetical protein [Neptuniibacter halophilus]
MKENNQMASSPEIALGALALLLGDLLNSVLLDGATEARDCLDCFEDYDWVMNPNGDRVLFDELLKKGLDGDMSITELDQFMGMLSAEGNYHHYLSIYQGRQALAGHPVMINGREIILPKI